MTNSNFILEPDRFYHIYNRANGNDLLFNNNDNYNFFLTKYKVYILPIADLYAYCLMPNHFHFLVKIKTNNKLERLIMSHKENVKYNKTLQGFETLAGLEKHEAISFFLTKQWSNLFNAYTQAFNKMHHRKGSLFMRNYKRKRVDKEQYLKKLIHYIHYNPKKAGLVDDIYEWKYSSCTSILSKMQTNLMRDEIIELFGDIENYKYCHTQAPNLTGIDKFF